MIKKLLCIYFVFIGISVGIYLYSIGILDIYIKCHEKYGYWKNKWKILNVFMKHWENFDYTKSCRIQYFIGIIKGILMCAILIGDMYIGLFALSKWSKLLLL